MNTSTSLLRRSKRPAIAKLAPTEINMSPPLRSLSRRSSIDSFDEEYFDRTYVPLTNLPTPPMSSHSNASSRRASYEDGCAPEYMNPNMLGPATHLTNLIPTAVSLEEPCSEIVQGILTRADLPYESIALAVNILDSLNARFAAHFRQSFPSQQDTYTENQNTGTLADVINPEVIPLAALILSVKFLDDAQESTRYYVKNWARGMWTCQQVNYAERCLMENLGWRLLPLWDEDMTLTALQDMERAGRMAQKLQADESPIECEKGMSDGKAVMNAYHQLTPGESPTLFTEKLRRLELETIPALSLDNSTERQVLPMF